MTLARVQHIYQSKTGLPRDDIVTTFYFNGTGEITPEVVDTLILNVGQFYNFQGTGQTDAVSTYIGESMLKANRERYKIYDVTGPPPHIPVAEAVMTPTLPNNTTSPLPPEIALCLSYSGTILPGLSPARRRGRVFIGPLNQACLASAGGISRPTSNVQTALVQAGMRLVTNSIASNWTWVLRSPTNNNTVNIVDLWCDDAWDIQRRRGNSPSMRISDTF